VEAEPAAAPAARLDGVASVPQVRDVTKDVAEAGADVVGQLRGGHSGSIPEGAQDELESLVAIHGVKI
jgi:hypothetical protein